MPDEAPQPSSAERAQAEALLQKGLDYYDRGDLEKALASYREATLADPLFVLAYNNLGMVLIDLERYGEAEEALGAAVRLDPNAAEPRNNLGFVLRRMGRELEAVEAYEKYLELTPEAEGAERIREWIASVRAAQAPAAAAAPEAQPSQRLLIALPSEAEAQAAPATVAPATDEAAVAPTVSPALAEAGGAPAESADRAAGAVELLERGYDLFAEGELEAAAGAFRQSQGMAADLAEAHTGLARVMMQERRLGEAVEELSRSLELSPDDPAACYWLGCALRAGGRDAEAAEAYQKFLELLPGVEEAEKIRQWITQTQAHPQTGVPPLPAEVDLPSEPSADASPADKQYLNARRRFQEGDLEGARKLAAGILKETPNHLLTHILLGRIYLRERQYDDAVATLEMALQGNPNHPEALFFAGQACERKEDRSRAAQYYRRCLNAAPQGPRAESLKEWLSATERSTGAGVQCELCLRVFPPQEVSEHEGKKICKACLVLIGARPALPEAETGAAAPAPDLASGPTPAARTRGFILAGALLLLLLLAAGLYFSPLGKMLGLRTTTSAGSTKTDVDTRGTTTIIAPPRFDPKDVVLAEIPDQEAGYMKLWTYSPTLTGLANAPKDLRLRFSLKQAPPEMTIEPETGKLAWLAQSEDTAALMDGQNIPVEVEACGEEPSRAGEKLFTLSRAFKLRLQFGFQSKGELDLGINRTAQVVWARGEFNGQPGTDLAIASGNYGVGQLRFFFHNPEHPLTGPLVFGAGQIQGSLSALQTVDLNGDGTDDLLAANSYSGKLHVVLQRRGELALAPREPTVGAGPVALAAADLGQDGRRQVKVGVLLGAGQSLVLCRWEAPGELKTVKSVPLAPGGPRGWLFPWRSAKLGAGFAAVAPLAEAPLVFVPWADAEPGAGKATAWPGPGLISGAAAVRAPDGTAALILLVNGQEGELCLATEENGVFTMEAAGRHKLDGLGLSLAAGDWNQDGWEDVAVLRNMTPGGEVARGEVRLVFRTAQGWKAGPRYEIGCELEGGCESADLNGDGRPDLFLVTAERRAWLLLSAGERRERGRGGEE